MIIDTIKTHVEPCPFCGNEEHFSLDTENTGGKYSSVMCGECSAKGPDTRTNYIFKTWQPWCDVAVREWNNRDADKG